MDAEIFLRTEDIPSGQALKYYVATQRDQAILDDIKSRTPLVLVGSRGTGKSLMFRVAEEQLCKEAKNRIIPVYISFHRSALVNSSDPNQFYHWMLARICSRISRELRRRGMLTDRRIVQTLTGASSLDADSSMTPIERVIEQYESSTKGIEVRSLPNIDELKDAVEDFCVNNECERLCLLFDEAAHVFRPQQQRDFFSLFRDLRSAHISCKAAVYPGITSFGDVFDPTHDAKFVVINRFVEDVDYLRAMKEMVLKQVKEKTQKVIESHGEEFSALAYAASGNPRLLLKTVQQVEDNFSSKTVKSMLKEFFRSEVWREHSMLAEKFAGHRDLIDWSRTFVERVVIPGLRERNGKRQSEQRDESTCFFWVHRDSPKVVFHSLRLLAYSGIVVQRDEGVVGTRAAIGTRYSVNLGCLVSPEAEPVPAITSVARTLVVKRFLEYGAKTPDFLRLADQVGNFSEIDTTPALENQLSLPTDRLELTPLQTRALKELNITTIGAALRTSEVDFAQVKGIKKIRAKKLRDAIVASVLEYLSG